MIFLVLATGCVPRLDRIEGLAEAGNHFYQYEAARKLADKIATIEKGRVFITALFLKRQMYLTNVVLRQWKQP